LSGLSRRARRAAVFLDRDGTLVRDRDYLSDPRDLSFFKRVPAALRLLKGAGFLLIVTSNQSGVGRGYFTEEDLRRVDRRMKEALAAKGAALDAAYYCPHAPAAGCACRKPGVGMLRRAARERRVDLKKSYVVGDSPRDLQMGHRLGLKAALVLTGYGRRHRKKAGADRVSKDLWDAARWIVKDARP
jgi:histidinol-phosphate phosphatase family protein